MCVRKMIVVERKWNSNNTHFILSLIMYVPIFFQELEDLNEIWIWILG